jgi:hypothetical protein
MVQYLAKQHACVNPVPTDLEGPKLGSELVARPSIEGGAVITLAVFNRSASATPLRQSLRGLAQLLSLHNNSGVPLSGLGVGSIRLLISHVTTVC